MSRLMSDARALIDERLRGTFDVVAEILSARHNCASRALVHRRSNTKRDGGSCTGVSWVAAFITSACSCVAT